MVFYERLSTLKTRIWQRYVEIFLKEYKRMIGAFLLIIGLLTRRRKRLKEIVKITRRPSNLLIDWVGKVQISCVMNFMKRKDVNLIEWRYIYFREVRRRMMEAFHG